ncbi:MAG: DNA mismatch repair protein MutS [Clostridiales bacterium]|nr:DNA mismatch repair protein MutS [Clostridiales bacterium]MCF8023733.1 DNA mismatch repair protein MutS [Clostridiales bacterium]
MDSDVKGAYQSRKVHYANKLTEKKKKSSLLSWLRVISFIAAVGFLLAHTFYASHVVYLAAIGILAAFFVLLVNRHNRVKEEIKYIENLHYINEIALLRLSGEWTGFLNTGEQYIEPEHRYTADLNIFGQGSLFQFINAAASYLGERKLAKALSSPAVPGDIQQRQEAVKELGPRLDWRQHFQAVSMGSIKKSQNPEKLLAWAEDRSLAASKRYYSLLRYVPLITLGLVILDVLGAAAHYFWIIPFMVQIIIVALTGGKANKAFSATDKMAEEIQSYYGLLSSIEEEDFHSLLLADLKGKLVTGARLPSRQIKNLFKIVERLNLRHSSIHVVINILTLWDLHNLVKLERWKDLSGRYIRTWLDVIAEFEVVSSLAGMHHDHPEWAFPGVKMVSPEFEASELGHPLIRDGQRVCNDVSLPQPGTILLITGSNMSGKSTLLKTVGINLVLAYAGAPACAEKLDCSLMDIYTSMENSDSLEQNISTFYAELKRIKMVVDAVKTEKPVIFLIDEIFKGTNSGDRIFGARAVLRNISKYCSIGLVSTHDLELSELEKENQQIKNYHFTDEISGGEISFDYYLKPGVSQSTNAVALMKIIGLEVE